MASSLDGCGICAKFVLLFFNFLFVISGLILLGFGILCELSYKHLLDFISLPVSLSIVLAIVGALILINGIFGCCGVYTESRFLVITYATGVVLIMIVEVIAGIGGVLMHNQIESVIDHKMNETFNSYYTDQPSKKVINLIQFELECCGTTGPDYWTDSNQKMPLACCSEVPLLEDANTPADCTLDSAYVFRNGCKPVLVDFFKTRAILIVAIGLGVVATQILGLMYACCLAHSIKVQYQAV